MLKKEIQTLLEKSAPYGWVLEPDAKRIFEVAGVPVPQCFMAQAPDEAVAFAEEIGYPVVAKIVSPEVVHKTEVNGVTLNIQDAKALEAVYDRYAGIKGFVGVLVEETVRGQELIIGGKMDAQFGQVVLLGMGGTGVEIYKDTALRMAPIQEQDVIAMVDCLTAGKVLRGFRGKAGIDMDALIRLMISFSDLLMALGDQITSIDLNPVICSPSGCTVADARIMLKGKDNLDGHGP